MPKHETQNIYYGITWEVNTVSQLNLASVCNIIILLSKKFMKNVTWKLVPDPF